MVLRLFLLSLFKDWFIALIVIFGFVEFRTESFFLTAKITTCAVILLAGGIITVIAYLGGFIGLYSSKIIGFDKFPDDIFYSVIGLNLLAIIIGGYGVAGES